MADELDKKLTSMLDRIQATMDDEELQDAEKLDVILEIASEEGEAPALARTSHDQ